jgi:hypothetical protein
MTDPAFADADDEKLWEATAADGLSVRPDRCLL